MSKKSGWIIRAGASIGGFTVGHRAQMNGNDRAAAFIVGIREDGPEIRVLLHFLEAQPVDVPAGETSHRFDVSYRNIRATWTSVATVRPHLPFGVPPVYSMGSAPTFVPKGYSLVEEAQGTLERVQKRFTGKPVVLIQSAELNDRPGEFLIGVFGWTPNYEKWRHGGWYVSG